MTSPFSIEDRVADLRRGFDQAFTVAPQLASEALEDLLAVRVAGAPYALRVRETSGVAANRKIVPLPTRRSDLLGVAGMRGSVVSVYDLAALLGHPREEGSPAWLVLAGSPEPVALAFGGLDGFLRVHHADIHGAAAVDGIGKHIREVVRAGALARPIVDLPSTLRALRSGTAGSVKER